MRIAFLTPYGPGLGGMEVFTERLERALAPFGHSFEWFTFEHAKHEPEFRLSNTLSFLPQRETLKARAMARTFNQRAHEFDVVIANDYFGLHVKHPRVILVMHGYYPDIHASMPKGVSFLKRVWWDQLGGIQKRAMAKAWKSITVSTRNARILRQAGCRVDAVIPHGIDTEFFAPVSSPHAKLKIPSLKEGPFLLFVGSHAPWKNPQMVESLSMIHRVAWLGRYSGSAPTIIPLPRLTDAQMPALYSAASALIHPAFHEGYGYAPIEAMACGTPVVFTRSGIGEEIEKDLPELILTNPADEAEARAKVEHILAHRVALGKKSRAWVEAHAAWKPWAKTWNALIEEAR